MTDGPRVVLVSTHHENCSICGRVMLEFKFVIEDRGDEVRVYEYAQCRTCDRGPSRLRSKEEADAV